MLLLIQMILLWSYRQQGLQLRYYSTEYDRMAISFATSSTLLYDSKARQPCVMLCQD